LIHVIKIDRISKYVQLGGAFLEKSSSNHEFFFFRENEILQKWALIIVFKQFLKAVFELSWLCFTLRVGRGFDGGARWKSYREGEGIP